MPVARLWFRGDPHRFERGIPVSVNQSAVFYALLKGESTRQGIFERSRLYYLFLIFGVFTGYGLCVWAIFSFENFWLLGLSCLAFTAFSIQVAGLMHDSGHRAVFSSIQANDILGYAAASLLGMVFDNWRSRHNAHHANPNEVDKDPDMDIPFLATSARGYAAKGPLERFCTRWQAYYYYPLSAMVSFSNRLGSISYFLKPGANRWQLALYLPGIFFLFVSPFVFFEPAKALFVLFVVHTSSGMYLSTCFAPNHKGMAEVANGANLGFFEQQVITSRNVSGGLLTETLLVGLNHQIEHHLFPSCPRNKLKRLKPLVSAACREANLPYTESGMLETNRIIIRHLSDALRPAPDRVP